MTKKISRKDVEKTTLQDVLYTASSTALSFIPGAGELFNACVKAPAEWRRNDWIESLEKELYKLKSVIPDIIERVQHNERSSDSVWAELKRTTPEYVPERSLN